MLGHISLLSSLLEKHFFLIGFAERVWLLVSLGKYLLYRKYCKMDFGEAVPKATRLIAMVMLCISTEGRAACE
jgi:hypothetical protein